MLKMICSPESMNKILFFNKDKNVEKDNRK